MNNQDGILGVDVGGTGIKGGIVGIKTGKLLTERHRINTPQPATPAAVAKTFKSLVDHFNYSGPIGVGFPAIVRRGIALSASNISKEWIDTSIADTLSKACGQPIYVLNDADAAGIAAMNFGAGQPFQNHTVLMITIGTGIGSGLFVDCKLVPNTEFGHIYLQNQKTIAEKFVSNALRKKQDWSWDKFGKRLNKYLQHIDLLLSPDLIIIGGGASKHFAKYQSQLNVKASVQPALLLNNAGTIGAAMYAYQKHFQQVLK